jgi:ATP-binding cassette subfamily B protein
MMEEVKDQPGFTLLRRIYSLAAPYKVKLTIAILLTICMSFLGPYRPFLVQHTIDAFVTTGDEAGVIRMSLLILVLLIVQSMMQVWATILTNFLGQAVIRDLRLKVYDHLLSLRMKFFDRTPVGTLVTRTVSDIETIADVFSEGLINISGDVLQILFILAMMFWSDWQLSLVSLSVLPLLLYSGYLFKEKVRLSFEDVRTQVARLNTFVQEHIQGMQIVQIFNREKVEMERFGKINAEHRDANIRSVFYYSVFFPVIELIAAVSTALIVWYGARGVLGETTSVGTMIAFMMYIHLFFRPIRQLADRFNTLQMGMVASERIFKLIDDRSHHEHSGKVDPGNLRGDVEFRDVHFGYNENEPVLKGISLNVKKGSTIALVGATGAGKTSVISLLNRFYEAQGGQVLIDGMDIRSFDVKLLRKQISVVMQDVFLFSGTIMDNIRLYDPGISEEAVISASKILGAHTFIERLPNGYQQEVQERGATLSAGQRQLISFVRALVADPAILVLDEATSSVDNETEEIIRRAIEKLMAGRTSIVIAHRLSTIRHAEEIIVLDKGEIIERGTHAQLLEKDGAYRMLYEMQFADNAA